MIDLDLTDSPHWDYVDGFDTPQSYEAFEYYRDSSPRLRSFRDTAIAVGMSDGAVYRWAARFLWRERVASFDAYRARQRDTLRATREQVTDTAWAEKRGELLDKATEIATAELTRLMHDLSRKRRTMRPNELTRLLEVTIKNGNLANGDVTERVDVPLDLSNMTPERLAALEELRSMLGKDQE